ncbi:hypothetical protein AOLI_G00017830 [Acnodon oligacanthus]
MTDLVQLAETRSSRKRMGRIKSKERKKKHNGQIFPKIQETHHQLCDELPTKLMLKHYKKTQNVKADETKTGLSWWRGLRSLAQLDALYNQLTRGQ